MEYTSKFNEYRETHFLENIGISFSCRSYIPDVMEGWEWDPVGKCWNGTGYPDNPGAPIDLGVIHAPKILNLTQHRATQEQVKAGVVDLPEEARTELKKLLTFNSIPKMRDRVERARDILALLPEHEETNGVVMIGGAPWFMSVLEAVLKENKITPVYAFSLRESVEETDSLGNVKKSTVFRHKGFILASNV